MPVGLLLAGAAATKAAEGVAVVAAGLTAYKVRKNGKAENEKKRIAEEEKKEKEKEETDTYQDTDALSADLAGTGLDDDYDIANWMPGAHFHIDGEDRQSSYSTRSNLDDYSASIVDMNSVEEENLTSTSWTEFIWGQKARSGWLADGEADCG
jgi:hypothetical protein